MNSATRLKHTHTKLSQGSVKRKAKSVNKGERKATTKQQKACGKQPDVQRESSRDVRGAYFWVNEDI